MPSELVDVRPQSIYDCMSIDSLSVERTVDRAYITPLRWMDERGYAELAEFMILQKPLASRAAMSTATTSCTLNHIKVFLNQLPGNRMKRIPLPPKRTHCEVPIDLVHRPKDWSTEFHASLDNTCTVLANDPIGCLACKDLGDTRSMIPKCKLVEGHANLCIWRRRELVQLIEVYEVCQRELGINLKALEEDDDLIRIELLQVRIFEVETRRIIHSAGSVPPFSQLIRLFCQS